jgi:hypothetical protein
MKLGLVVLSGMLLVVHSYAQQPYTVKGFTLGVSTLADFKAQFHHCADNCSEKAQKKYGAVFAPHCSDDFPGARLTPDRADSSSLWTAAGLVFCEPYFPFENFRGQYFTIADINTSAEFNFFAGKLFRISAAFQNIAGVNFKAMRESLIAKFGAPTKEVPRIIRIPSEPRSLDW